MQYPQDSKQFFTSIYYLIYRGLLERYIKKDVAYLKQLGLSKDLVTLVLRFHHKLFFDPDLRKDADTLMSIYEATVVRCDIYAFDRMLDGETLVTFGRFTANKYKELEKGVCKPRVVCETVVIERENILHTCSEVLYTKSEVERFGGQYPLKGGSTGDLYLYTDSKSMFYRDDILKGFLEGIRDTGFSLTAYTYEYNHIEGSDYILFSYYGMYRDRIMFVFKINGESNLGHTYGFGISQRCGTYMVESYVKGSKVVYCYRTKEGVQMVGISIFDKRIYYNELLFTLEFVIVDDSDRGLIDFYDKIGGTPVRSLLQIELHEGFGQKLNIEGLYGRSDYDDLRALQRYYGIEKYIEPHHAIENSTEEELTRGVFFLFGIDKFMFIKGIYDKDELYRCINKQYGFSQIGNVQLMEFENMVQFKKKDRNAIMTKACFYGVADFGRIQEIIYDTLYKTEDEIRFEALMGDIFTKFLVHTILWDTDIQSLAGKVMSNRNMGDVIKFFVNDDVDRANHFLGSVFEYMYSALELSEFMFLLCILVRNCQKNMVFSSIEPEVVCYCDYIYMYEGKRYTSTRVQKTYKKYNSIRTSSVEGVYYKRDIHEPIRIKDYRIELPRIWDTNSFNPRQQKSNVIEFKKLDTTIPIPIKSPTHVLNVNSMDSTKSKRRRKKKNKYSYDVQKEEYVEGTPKVYRF